MKALLPLLFAASAFAQPFSAGVKVGLPLTDFVNTVNGTVSSKTNRYLVGPTVELHLPAGFGVELDALYRRFDYSNPVGSTVNGVITFANTTSSAWEFPLLLKYRFPAKVVRPYVDAGVAWDKVSNLANTLSGNSTKSTTMGAVVGAGLDVHVLIVHILPELRYTRWTDQHFNITNVLHSNQNQAEFMVGITF
jgi:opacity protein-like surface antigen